MVRTTLIAFAVLTLGTSGAAAATGGSSAPGATATSSPTTTYIPPVTATTPAASTAAATTPPATPGATPASPAPGATPATSVPASTTPQEALAKLTQAKTDTAQAKKSKGDRPLSTGAIVIAALAALLILACIGWALARRRAFEPHWLLSLRHAMAEAGFRASATWSEFADWARLGR
ncbi:MAG TPA: hypothetical protein VGH21_06725 [Solirubrobacteraceae bacterium]